MDPITGIATIGSGILGMFGANRQNKAQIKMAREQMAFQERMSNTAHQREIADLQAAGLNPILSAKLGGASSPGGAQPNIVNEMAPLSNSALSLSDKMYNSKLQDAQVNNMRLQNDVLQQQVEQLKISNAQQGRLTPIHNTVGDAVEYGVNKVKDWWNGGKGSNDILADVLDAGGNAVSGNGPPENSAKILDRMIGDLPTQFGTKDSEARKWASGKKGFLESFKDANRKQLTEEEVRRYGLKRLKQIQQTGRSTYNSYRYP